MDNVEFTYFFAALIAIEYLYNRIAGHPYQSDQDLTTSVMVAVPHFLVLSITPVLWFVSYAALGAHVVPWQLDASAWWVWPLGVVVMDFATYWMHRYHHALNMTWAIHSVHHSSEEFTMSTGFRSSMAEPLVNVLSGAFLFLVAPVVIGLPLEVAATGYLVKDFWGFAVHTRNIDKLGLLERFMATPSHHRVHHAMNDVYLGKNFAFVFIVWDKLFGTFQPELASHPPVYGVRHPPRSFNPIAVSFHELAWLWRDAVRTRRWRDRLRLWYMPAGWRPADAAARNPRRAVDPRTYAKYSRPTSPAATWLTALHLGWLTVATLHVGLTAADHGLASNALYLLFAVFGTLCAGLFLERARRFAAWEVARTAMAVVAAATGWFGRGDGAVVAALLAIQGAMVLSALALSARERRRVLR